MFVEGLPSLQAVQPDATYVNVGCGVRDGDGRKAADRAVFTAGKITA
jgi:hypothetical protein